MSTRLAILELDTFVVLTTGNLRRGYGSWQAVEFQITQAHADEVHFEQRDRSTMCINPRQEYYVRYHWPNETSLFISRICIGKVFYGQEPPSGESTTTECGVKYHLYVQ